jgi:alcohol dehydrogenase
VLIVGAGPVGLAAMITCQLYSPSMIIMVDIDPNLLKVTKSLEAHHTIDPSDRKYRESCEISDRWEATDTVTDAAGTSQTFELCRNLVTPGGVITNVGFHRTKAGLNATYSEADWPSSRRQRLGECH